MSSKKIYIAKKKVKPFKRGWKWVRAHYRTILLTGEGLAVLYSLYLTNKFGHKMLEHERKKLSEAQERFQSVKQKVDIEDHRLEEMGFRDYLKEKHNITDIKRMK